MDNKRYIVFEKKSVIIAVFVFIIMLLVGLFIAINNIIPPFIITNKIILVIYWIIIIVILIFGGFIGFVVSIEWLIMTIYDEHKINKCYKNVNKQLSNNFSKIELKDFETAKLSKFISNEDIICMARLDENGNINYKITVNIEDTTNKFKAFMESFYI